MKYKLPVALTPKQVAKILQLSKSSVYKLINQGEIKAKKYGNVYRIPARSLSFITSGLDYDLRQKEEKDLENREKVEEALNEVRTELWE